MNRNIALGLAFLAGTLAIVAFFTPQAQVTFAKERLDGWMPIVSAFALVLGVVDVVKSHSRKISRQEPGWFNSVVVLAGLVAMGGAGILGFLGIPSAGIASYPDGSPTPFEWMFRSIYQPLTATMFGLITFYMASAAFRAFRVRSLQATLLLLAAVVVMLGRIPFGGTLLSWLPAGWGAEQWLASLTDWTMSVPSTAAQSGIQIGAALGAASMSLRIILGLETSYLGKGNGA